MHHKVSASRALPVGNSNAMIPSGFIPVDTLGKAHTVPVVGPLGPPLQASFTRFFWAFGHQGRVFPDGDGDPAQADHTRRRVAWFSWNHRQVILPLGLFIYKLVALLIPTSQGTEQV